MRQRPSPIIALLLLLSVVLFVPQLAFTQSETGEGWLFLGYLSYTSTQFYTMNPDGSDIKPLMVNGAQIDALYATPSPDGRFIALLRAVETNSFGSITTVSIDLFDRAALTITPLVQFPYNASLFSWSPDSQSIIYAAGNATFTDIMVIGIDGSDQRLIVDGQSPKNQAFDPAMSPDGTQIAFTLNQSLAVVNTDGSNLRVLVQDDGRDSIKRPVWSPDGTTIAYWRSRSFEVQVVRLDGSAPVTISQPGIYAGLPSWLPASNTLVFVSGTPQDNGVYTVNADGSGAARLPAFNPTGLLTYDNFVYLPPIPAGAASAPAEPATSSNVQPQGTVISASNAASLQVVASAMHQDNLGAHLVAFRPGSSILAYADGFFVQLLDMQTNAVTAVLPLTARVSSLAFSPDGSRLAVGDASGLVQLFDATTTALLASQQIGDDVVVLAFNPTGTTLAVGASAISLWDGLSLAQVGFVSLNNGLISDYINDLTFSADGAKIAYAEETGYSGVIDLATGSSLAVYSRMVRDHNGGSRLTQRAVALHPAGTWAATCHDSGFSGGDVSFYSVDIWDIHTGETLMSFQGHESLCRSIAFSPDGAVLATAGTDFAVRLWDVATGQELAVLPTQDRDVNGLAFSPDGTKLAVWSTNQPNGGNVQWWAVPS